MKSALLHLYLSAPAAVPKPQRKAPDGLKDKVDLMLGLAAWAGTAAGVLGIVITGAMMGISLKRGESSEHMSRLGMVLGGCCIVASAGPFASWVFK
ncbi:MULTISPECIES: hypothetical protein [unclassified Streptomyces]|uniref:hypothetical protein n=1 Tax=unclassified Streptomyces TaxID=2593676 RepID=UPI002DDA2EA0|nr:MULTISPECIES: hypothetical protein [unclassified Streptomyces]WSA91379.1 hypothetical protein OIE63_07275 [Streptomyces sp. NBC_01795]WSB75703.1 hypothetical protein OHB04_07800 [Streptomyces sp. NBC_01775]WSS16013.1 hypothetical protein OG533_32090 [Streptomyces sp. NBC_01186]WSS44831.1 hypothetical protein OG220_32770 [Streptomyces sp. NBC_01187]